VTRPEPGASRTAAALAEAGLDPVVMPFTRTVGLPVPEDRIAAARACDAVVVTSAKALTHAPAALRAALAGKPVFTVGDATAAAVPDDAGTVLSADGDALALADLVASELPKGRSVLYLCGHVRTGTLEDALSDAGYAPVLIETYDVEKVSHMTDTLAKALDEAPPDAIMFHSGVSAGLFLEAVVDQDLSEVLEKIAFFVISERVARRLDAIPSRSVTASPEPRDDALVACVRRALAGRQALLPR